MSSIRLLRLRAQVLSECPHGEEVKKRDLPNLLLPRLPLRVFPLPRWYLYRRSALTSGSLHDTL